MMKLTVGLFVLAGLATGCSLKKSLDETTSATQQMKDSTDGIRRDSDLLAARTDDMNSELTLDASTGKVTDHLNILFGEAPGQYPANEVGYLKEAGIAINAMWFQYWKGNFNDVSQRLDERFELGADLLLAHVKEHSSLDHPIDKFYPDRNYLGCASIAVELDTVLPQFTESLARAGLGPYSFYDLVVDALASGGSKYYKGSYPLAVTKVLEYKQDAIYLLQLRQNYYSMMVYAELVEFAGHGMFERTPKYFMTQTVDLAPKSNEQLARWTRWLKAAKQTREDLVRIGIQPEYNMTFQKFLRGLDFGQEAILSEPATTHLDDVGQARRDFAQAFTDLLISTPQYNHPHIF
jgi:hypothetical protein